MIPPEQIDHIEAIQALLRTGFTDWKRYGSVNVTYKGQLALFSYHDTKAHEARWNVFEQMARGLILNRTTGEVVARPFDKFYNWFEGGRISKGHIVSVTEKVDGSLGILYREGGRYAIATKGAFDSPQARWATEFLNAYFDLSDLPNELTLLFEILYPANRVVVDYNGREDLVLLAARNRFTGEYLPFFPELYDMAQHYGFSTPTVYDFNNVTQLIEATGTLDEQHEGWVVEFSDGVRFKFKGDRYIELHQLVSKVTYKTVLQAIQEDRLWQLFAHIPEDLLQEPRRWEEEITTTVSSLRKRIGQAFREAPRGSRQEFTRWVQREHPDLALYLFHLWDGKSIEPLIYQQAEQQHVN